MKDGIHSVVLVLRKFHLTEVRYVYRSGPVPHVHKKPHHKCYVSHVAQNYKQKEMLRPKTRVDLGDLWWDDYRHIDRCWKTNHKCRHQWEKHLK